MTTDFLRILERKARLEMGRRLLRSFVSKPSFFNMGVMTAFFKAGGTYPVEKEKWMIVTVRGRREGRQALKRTVGRISSLQEGLDFMIRSEMNLGVGKSKTENW